jgi:beta-lactamase regulating signal transducer with metallopeptidase domain
MDSTIRELLNNLMIEQWNVSPIFENYYNACQPINCTYTLETNNNLIYIVTTLFGIAGGLITVLKFIVPKLVKLVRKKKQQQQQITGKIKSKMITRVKTDDQFHHF